MSRRIVSKARAQEIDEARKGGYATECIREHCVLWSICSPSGDDVCTSDLSTGFYKRFEKEEGYYNSFQTESFHYRKPGKAKTKTKKKH